MWNSLETVTLLSTTFRWIVAIAGVAALIFGTRAATLQTRAAAPRSVSAEQRQAFLVLAQKQPKGPVTLIPIMSNVESERYARELGSLLKEAGYIVEESGMIPMDNTPTGLRLTVKQNEPHPPHTDGLQTALSQAGIAVVRGYNGLQNVGVLGLVVGAKPLER